jgi:hypothetical protein
VMLMECLIWPRILRFWSLPWFSTKTIKSSVSYPANFPCSFILLIGQHGMHGANPPVSMRTTKDACTCASNCPPPPPVENGLLSCLPLFPISPFVYPFKNLIPLIPQKSSILNQFKPPIPRVPVSSSLPQDRFLNASKLHSYFQSTGLTLFPHTEAASMAVEMKELFVYHHCDSRSDINVKCSEDIDLMTETRQNFGIDSGHFRMVGQG